MVEKTLISMLKTNVCLAELSGVAQVFCGSRVFSMFLVELSVKTGGVVLCAALKSAWIWLFF
ncbi:MAG: hypothetical protein ACFCUE_15085 [Candidatus Bathyarchaeia archaeon]